MRRGGRSRNIATHHPLGSIHPPDEHPGKAAPPLMNNRLLLALAATLFLGLGLSACADSAEPEVDPAPATTADSASSPTESSTPAATATSGTGSSAATDTTTEPTGSTVVEAPPLIDSEGITLGGPGEVIPAGMENAELSADPFLDIIPGNPINIKVSGLNPDLGYHVAICSAAQPAGGTRPHCTGEIGEPRQQAWLRNEGGSHGISPDGSASLALAATATGADLDCTTQECVIKVFGDEDEGFRTVTDLPVLFAAG